MWREAWIISKTLKQIKAGRLVCAVVYTTPSAGDSSKVRAEKQHASNEAREKLNARTSLEKLERVLAANFDSGDLYVTLTYDDKHLPPDRSAAVRRIRSFIPKLREARKARGEGLAYVYVTEGAYPGGRLHHHMVLNATGDDIEELRAVWKYGANVEVRRLRFDEEYTYGDLASYLTKEPREWGHPKVGERTWTPAIGLRRPQQETFNVPDNLTLMAPPDAVSVEVQRSESNGFGSYSWIKYLLPPEESKRKRSKKRKRKNKKE